MKELIKYEPKEYIKPSSLVGISDDQINYHWALYLEYVNQVNRINEEISQILSQKNSNTFTYLDRKRRLGFEYNGMVLHEYYFSNLCSKCIPSLKGPLLQELEKNWGSFQQWQDDFKTTGKSRGVGWAILYIDPTHGLLLNCFIESHEIGHISGFIPIIVMDTWEHAYILDQKVGGKADYIDAFMSNINWEIVQKRYLCALECKLLCRF